MRLTAVNGREIFSEMNRILKVPNRQSNFNVGHPAHDEFIEALAPYINCSTEALKVIGTFNSPYFKYDAQRGVQDIILFTPKLCPQCIEEGGFFHLEWQSLLITHCVHHQSPLIDNCPKCDRALVWHSDIFHGCPHEGCDYRWNDHSKIKSYTSYLIHLNGLEEDKQDEAIRHLVTVAAMLMRPFDLLHKNHKKVSIPNNEICIYLRQAHALLMEPELIGTWFLALNAVNRFIGPLKSPIETYIYTHQQAYKVTNSEVECITLPCGPIEQKNLVTRDKEKLQTTPSDVHYYVDSITARTFLGLSLESFNTLRAHDRIAPMNTPRLLRDEIFDIRSLDHFTRRLLNRNTCQAPMHSSLIPIRELIPLTKLFGLNAGHVLEILSSHPGEVASLSGESKSWLSLYLNRTIFIGLLEKHYLSFLSERTSIKKLKRMLCVTESQLKKLLVTNKIRVFESSCRHEVDTSDVETLLSDVCILNREACLIGNTTIESLYALLKKRGHKTALTIVDRGRVVLMQRTLQLEKDLHLLRNNVDADPI
jgi:hypothetical protein